MALPFVLLVCNREAFTGLVSSTLRDYAHVIHYPNLLDAVSVLNLYPYTSAIVCVGGDTDQENSNFPDAMSYLVGVLNGRVLMFVEDLSQAIQGAQVVSYGTGSMGFTQHLRKFVALPANF